MGDSDTTDLERTVSSLLFFAFGFDFSDLRNTESDSIVLDRLIEKAYRDATNQGAFNTHTKGMEDAREKAKDGGIEILKDHICSLTEKDRFDGWHESLCEALIKKYAEKGFKKYFTYGNAQKWVNMTLKYADMLPSIYSMFRIKMPPWMDAIAQHHANLHLPVDSYIIESVWDRCDKSKGSEGLKADSCLLPLKKGKRLQGKYSSDKVKGWSTWSKDDYQRFRAGLSEILNEQTQIEWEAEAWINIAKQRKRD